MDGEIEKAVAFRKNGEFSKAISLLKYVFQTNRSDPEIAYQIDWTFDASGDPSKAIPHYRRALELGLMNDRVGCYVALGSSLRATGKYHQAKKLLQLGMEEFPEHKPLSVFLAMTLYNLQEHKAAVAELLLTLLDTTSDASVLAYKHACFAHAKDLDTKW